MAWVLLVIAGLLETIWSVGLKHTEGFTRLVPSLVVVACIAASMWLLAIAARTLPIGTAYATWVGLGAVGAGVLGMVLFNAPVSAARLFFLGLLVVAIIGLKVTGGAGH